MILREILQTKGTLVHSIERDDSLQEVVDRLVRHNCGSLVVVDSRSSEVTMVGIVTERDILQDAGKISAEAARLHAHNEFEKYRIVQDRLFESDFDRVMQQVANERDPGEQET